jgi:hypothetical protein
MTVRNIAIIVLNFAFDVEGDWPPIAVEPLRFSPGAVGYKLLAPPLFVKELSVGDVIQAEVSQDNISVNQASLRFRGRRGQKHTRHELLEPLEDSGGAHPSADAHRHHAVARASAAHLVHQRRGQLGAGAAEGMAKGDRAAVDVEAIGIDRQFLQTGQHLCGECFVQLDEVDLLE